MALSFIEEPKKVSLAGNPVIYKLQTNNLMASAGNEARHYIEFSQIPAAGEDFTLNWLNGGISIDFEVVNVVFPTGTHIPTGSGDLFTYLEEKFIPAMQANYYIDRDYSLFAQVTGGNPRVFFVARNPGTDYDLQFIDLDQGSSFGFVQVSAGQEASIRPNFRMFMQLYLRYSGQADFKKMELERVPVGTDSVFDLSTRLATQDKFILPDPSTLAPLNVSGQVIEYYIKVAEAYGEALQVQGLTTKDQNYALLGGFNEKDRLEFSFNDDHLPKLLTLRTNPRLRPDQPYFVTYFNTQDHTQYNLVIDLMSSGQSIHSRNLHTFNVPKYGQYLLPVNYNMAIDGVDLAGKQVDRIRIWVKKTNEQEPFTNIITCRMDYKKGPDEQYLAYRNSLNAYEVYCLRGDVEQLAEYEQAVADVIKAHDAPFKERGASVYNKYSRQSFDIYSGFLDQDESFDFHDMLSSRQVYLIRGSENIPVTIAAQKHKIRDTHSGRMNSYKITLTLNLDKYYSNVGNRI